MFEEGLLSSVASALVAFAVLQNFEIKHVMSAQQYAFVCILGIISGVGIDIGYVYFHIEPQLKRYRDILTEEIKLVQENDNFHKEYLSSQINLGKTEEQIEQKLGSHMEYCTEEIRRLKELRKKLVKIREKDSSNDKKEIKMNFAIEESKQKRKEYLVNRRTQ